MDFSLVRGDTHKITFKIKTDENVDYVLKDGDKLYFTVKKNFVTKEALLQKTYQNGITYNEQTNEYEIVLNQSCTCNIPCCSYVYDIKLIITEEGNAEPIVKTLIKGSIDLGSNATHKENE